MFFINLLLSMVPDKVVRSTADAFTEFYRVYLPKVFRYISYKIADTHLAEDLTSAVFEKALTKFKSYDENKAAFSTWIFRIARNTLRKLKVLPLNVTSLSAVPADALLPNHRYPRRRSAAGRELPVTYSRSFKAAKSREKPA